MFKQRAIGLGVIATGVLGYENIPPFKKIVDWGTSQIFDFIESSELAKRVAELEETYSTPTLIAGAIVVITAGSVVKILQKGISERKFNRMDYSDMLNMSYTFFNEDATIGIKNEGEGHLPTIFKSEPAALGALFKAAKNTNSSHIALNFEDPQQGWQVYERIRDHFNLLADKINVSQEHARKYAGKELTDVEYIGILTKGPQYTVDEERYLREVEGHDTPHTKTEIRFLPFPSAEVKSAIAWFEDQAIIELEKKLKTGLQHQAQIELDAKENDVFGIQDQTQVPVNASLQEPINVNEVIDKVCVDKGSCCAFTDRFIAYMLDIEEGCGEPLDFKYPTYRRRIVALAQAVREYYNSRPHLSYTISV